MNKLYMNKPINVGMTTMRLLLMMITILSISSLRANELSERQDSLANDEYTPPLYAGIHVGTSGIGLHLYTPLSQNFGLRLGASYMPFYTHIHGNYSNRDTRSKVEIRGANVSAIFAWTPFVTKTGFFRSFAVNAGAAYFIDLKGDITTRLAGDYYLGDMSVNPKIVGDIFTEVKYKNSISPYFGIGLNDIRLDERFSLHFDLGSYYLTEPKVSMEANGLLEGSTANAATIERNIKNYRFLPRAEFGISIRLK